MADDLVFGVKIDLQKGVEEALKDGDKALERIEKLFGKHPITIKLRMDNRVVRGTSAELTGFKKQLAELTQQWNSLTAAERGSAAGAAIREKFRALRTEAQGYTSTLQAAVNAEDKMRESHSKTAASVNKLSSAYHNQSTYLSRLIQRMAAYAGVSYVGNFLTNVREVTAQFELQRISLGAIIQDQQRANQLFEEIKTFALKSPVKILDLTKYTKQLAAYKIGVDELFDTTKRLTDISVGLGVSMDRIVLMYGQIRATGHLRASEVRQATEAGIPLVEELAKKLSKANGELVTAADVMDMISKRAISFDMVKEVFDDMTSAGGIFYNMQEKQGNTLFGMWQKLGDAAAVMYDQIGNTDSVNEGMKMAIQSLRYLMLHWKQVGIVVGGVSVYILANTIATKNNAIATAAATTANKLHIASLQQKLRALRLEQMNLKSTHIFQRLYTAATISATKAQIGAATSTNVFSKALYGLKAALLSNPLTALAVALTTIITLLMQSESELDKLNSKLQDIDRDYDASGKKSVDRFKELVKAVEENVDGSKAQKEALDELDRTYGKILGSEALELDSLKALGGQYGELIDLIEAYNAKKRGEEKKTAIESTSATIKDEAKDDLMDYLNQAGMSKEKQIEFMVRLNEKLIEYAGQADAAIKATDETFKEFADDISKLDAVGNILNVLSPDKLIDAWGVGFRNIGGWLGGKGMNYLYDYANALQKERELLEENEIATRNAVRGLDEYAEGIDNVGKALKNLDWSSQEALFNSLQDYNKKNPQTALSVPINLEFDPAKAQSEYEKMIEIGNMQIHAIFANLQNIASQEGVAIPEEFYKQAKSVVEGNKSFSFIDFEGLSKLFTSKKAKQAVAESKLLFESISPNDRTVAVFRIKLAQLASGADVELSTMTKYFMKAGDDIEDYAKKIKDAIEELEKELNRMQTTNQMIAEGGQGPQQGFSEEEIKKIQMQVAVLKELFPFLQGFTKGGSTRTSDPRLQNLKEEISLVQKLYNEYKQLEKQEGATKAAADMRRMAGDTLDMFKSKYNIDLPTDAKDLTAALEILYKKMAALPKKAFPSLDKDLKELRWTIEKVDIDESQKNIEAELKRLSDRISRTKTAKEFYEKILGMTGDYDLAAKVSLSVYGDTGYDLQKQIKKQLQTLVSGTSVQLPDTLFRSDDTIDSKALRKWAKENEKLLGEGGVAYKELIKVADEADKDFAKTVEGWLKATEKAKTYADKMVDLSRTTQAEIAKIQTSKGHAQTRISELLGLDALDVEQQKELKNLQGFLQIADNLIRGFQDKEDKEAAKLEYEAFKDTPLYVQMFEDLEHASTSTLEMMKQKLQSLQNVWGAALDPTQLKEIQSRMTEIDTQLRERNPFKTLKESYQQYRDAVKDYTIQGAEANVATAQAAYDKAVKDTGDEDSKEVRAAKKTLDIEKKRLEIAQKLKNEKGEQLKGQKAIDKAAQIANDREVQARVDLAEALAKEEKVKAEGGDLEAAHAEVEAKKEALNLAQATSEVIQKDAKTSKTLKENFASAANQVTQYMGIAGDFAHAVADTMEALGGDEDDIQYWNDIGTAIDDLTAGFQGLINAVMSLNIAGIISSVIGAVPNLVKGFVGLFSAGKVRRANREIKRQQELLEQLEYTYGRLEKAADKLFGRQYLQNYNQQLSNLQKQQEAYLKQAEAERSKGKKKDKDKIKEFEDKARETADKIKEMQDDLVAYFTGSNKADAARQMAKSWIDARSSMSDTFAAIKGDYQEMIKNMIVEGAAARVIENALTPMWNKMEAMLQKEDIDGAIDALVGGMDSALSAANNGMEVLWKALEARGYDMKKLISDTDSEYTGIAKSVAGATSEEINNVAAIGNTLMYYVSPIPRIDENLARVVAIMEGRAAALPTASGVTTGAVDYTDLFNTANQHLSSLPRMEQHLAEIHTMLGRALKTKGSTTGFNTFLNQ